MRKVFGVGINDAGYVVQPTVNGRRSCCPYYRVWHSMLRRCYSPKGIKRNPTYRDCTVTPEWHSFSAFRAWMLTQDHEGKELDKDILFPGNQVYSSLTCIFVSHDINSFLVDRGAARGDWPIGVSWDSESKLFYSQCNNPFTGKRGYLGRFDSPKAAHHAWISAKHRYALLYAELETDPRIADALRIRYLPSKEAN